MTIGGLVAEAPAAKPDGLNWIPRSHTVEGEK